jgi:hypothetical protein
MDDLNAGLAATANEPAADSTTIDATLDAAFDAPSEPTAGSDTPTSQEPASGPVAATQPPQEPAKTDGAKGEPPRERWDTILANARTKAAQDALAEHREHLEVVAELKRDFPGTLARLLEEAASNPQFSDTITAKAAALLNARKQSAKANEEPQPDAVMRYEDGTTEPTFSPAQLRKWNEWRERQMEAKLTEKFQPLQQLQQQFERHQQTKLEAEKAAGIAEKRSASWKSMPLFSDNKDAILARQQELYKDAATQPGFDPVNGPWELLQQAYGEVISATAIPKLQSQQTQQLVADAARKRAASSSDPNATAPAQPRKPRTPDEALDQVFSAYSGA